MTPLADLSATLLEGIGLKVILSGLFLLAGVVLAKLRETLPSRRMWRITDPSQVVISVAHSAMSNTGKYRRPATGIGQVQALALLMPSLRHAYSDLKIRNIHLSSDPLFERRENDLICLGSPKNNLVTADVLTHLGAGCPVSMEGSSITWTDRAGSCSTYEGVVKDGKVITDVGLIVRAINPFKPSRTVIILAGSHTYGTTAAARYFCEELQSPFRRRPRAFAALVKAEVRDGYPSSPELLRTAEIQ
jgi:hypothetical protein